MTTTIRLVFGGLPPLLIAWTMWTGAPSGSVIDCRLPLVARLRHRLVRCETRGGRWEEGSKLCDTNLSYCVIVLLQSFVAPLYSLSSLILNTGKL